MATNEPTDRGLLDGELQWLDAVVANLSNDSTKLMYADWLEERSDDRGAFLRAFVATSRSMDPADFPPAGQWPEVWLELIGYRMLERAASAGLPGLRDRLLRLARPALQLVEVEDQDIAVVPIAKDPLFSHLWLGIGQRVNFPPGDAERIDTLAMDQRIAVGASKYSGLPDLPPGFPWPLGRDCHATYAFYGDDPGPGDDNPAEFLAQISLAEIKDTQAARQFRLPDTGLLSFFCSVREVEGVPGWYGIGAKAVFFPDPTCLVQSSYPGGNEDIGLTHRLAFQEKLVLPRFDHYCSYNDPWCSELMPGPGEDYSAVLYPPDRLIWPNMLGYTESMEGPGPNRELTPPRQFQHLISLECSCMVMQILIDRDDLFARNFDRIILHQLYDNG
jgi:uncharacterized protein (TIGR02996 family)